MGHFVFLMFSYSQKNEKIASFHFKREKKSDLTKEIIKIIRLQLVTSKI